MRVRVVECQHSTTAGAEFTAMYLQSMRGITSTKAFTQSAPTLTPVPPSVLLVEIYYTGSLS